MAMPRRFPVEFGEAFPHGLFALGDVQPARDFDKSTRDQAVQAVDEESGLPVWTLDVIDPDPDAPKSAKAFTVRIVAKLQPVPPEQAPGSPFRQVELEGLAVAPYVSQPSNGGRARLAWSFRAAGIRAPEAVERPAPKKAA